jgi:coenzyme F420-reducing hydrogenase alpha subunit
MPDVSIEVCDVTRVEGHGNIVLNVKDSKIEELRWEITESPRFFEAMIVGRPWSEVTHITCRICGICSIGHTSASLRAVEDAFDIEISEQTLLMRKIAFFGETLQSHVLHVFYLVAPDLLGAPSVLPLIETHTDVIVMALRLKRLANDLCTVIGGRHIHPMAIKPKCFPHVPKKDDLADLKARLVASMDDYTASVELLKTLTLPDMEREIEFLSLRHPDEYALYRGTEVVSSCGESVPICDYRDIFHEFVVPHSTAKHAATDRGSYMVGALARFNNNYAQLCDGAKGVAEALGLQPVSMNPFMNSIAQVVECVQCTLEAIEVIDRLLDMDLVLEDPTVEVKAGRGIGASDVPRGQLFHDYTFDDDGLITEANLCIPTNQNHNNIEQDMYAFVPRILDWEKDDIRQFLEMLVRAYDPCISCSTHMLKVEFV